jgi:hypothetical protein
MIAVDTGHEYVDEDRFGVSQEGPFWELVNSPILQVIQAPGMAHICHKLTDEDVYVIFMERAPEDIIASQKRIEWTGEERERGKYGVPDWDETPICKVKYHVWRCRQIDSLQGRCHTQDYDRLSHHWMWIDPEHRTNFGPRQWRTG